jgi:superfamily II DNA/RNA helicase
LHGDLDQSFRTQTLARFKAGEVKLLIASDVAARGLDIPAVGHVFNYEPPRHAEDYVHRIGRTGRAGRSGQAFTLASPSDSKSIAAIEQLTGKALGDADVIPDLPTEALGDGRDSGGRGRRAEELKTERKTQFKKRDPERPSAATAPVASKAERDNGADKIQPLERPSKPRSENSEAAVQGFGDSIPAFLRTPKS